MLFSYPNVWNTCLLVLRSRGYRLFLLGDPDERGSISRCTWNAEKNSMKLRADNPIELLGLAALYEYHQPSADTPYWWRIDGPNVVQELEDQWKSVISLDAAREKGRTPVWNALKKDLVGGRDCR